MMSCVTSRQGEDPSGRRGGVMDAGEEFGW